MVTNLQNWSPIYKNGSKTLEGWARFHMLKTVGNVRKGFYNFLRWTRCSRSSRLNNCLKLFWHSDGLLTLRDFNQWLPLMMGLTCSISKHKWSRGLPNMLSREQKLPLWIWLAGTISPNPKSMNNGTPASWCSSIKCMPSFDMRMKAIIPRFWFFFIWAMILGL